MPAVLVDVGHHFVEPDTSGQTVTLSVVSTELNDPAVTGFELRAQIVTAKDRPSFQGVRFAGDLWNTYPHVESGGPYPPDPRLALGDVAFTHGFEASADGTMVTLTIDTTGIPAGSYELRLARTSLGSSSFWGANGGVAAVIINGTLQVRSIWQNPDNSNDVNGDGRISPLDVLLLMNELSKRQSHELQMPSPGEQPVPFFDVNGDGHLSPKDPLGVINCLNGLGCVTGPVPILAQVTSDPGLPDSTNVGGPDEFKPGDPNEPEDCQLDYVDEDGNPVPGGVDPYYCDDSNSVNPSPAPPGSNATPVTNPDPLTEELTHDSGQGLSNTPIAPNEFGAPVYPQFVDAIIPELVDELAGQDFADELVDLGLFSVFAIS